MKQQRTIHCKRNDRDFFQYSKTPKAFFITWIFLEPNESNQWKIQPDRMQSSINPTHNDIPRTGNHSPVTIYHYIGQHSFNYIRKRTDEAFSVRYLYVQCARKKSYVLSFLYVQCSPHTRTQKDYLRAEHLKSPLWASFDIICRGIYLRERRKVHVNIIKCQLRTAPLFFRINSMHKLKMFLNVKF